jgi:cardiolipin synthase C
MKLGIVTNNYLNRRSARFAFIYLLLAFLAACTTVSFDQPKTVTTAITDTQDTPFGQSLLKWQGNHPDGESAFYPLVDGLDALGARLRLIEGAQRSIDVQYFLMKDDDAGEVFAGSLLRAADRGVRVRFLLDDVFTTVGDDILALLDQHPLIEIRLFNPISRKGVYYLNYAGDFSRANRRMHSKSLTGDNAFTIIGGRNIADEYFQLRGDTEFLDYDVLALGEVAADVSRQFDGFWNSTLAVPISQVSKRFSEEELAIELAEIQQEMHEEYSSIYKKAIHSRHMQELIDGTGVVYAAHASLLSDGPAKLENPVDIKQMTLIQELASFVDNASESVIVITPYFIPGDNGVAYWQKLVDQGAQLTVVTNSLASTNHIPVHSGYARYRKQMVEMGALMHETRVNAVDAEDGGEGQTPESLTLHTKLMLIDQRYLFVGSLNLDPRSIEINAEMGLLIDSTAMAAQFMANAEAGLEARTYKVELDDKGRLYWRAVIDGQEVIESKEPLTSVWRRFLARVYRVLPESQL